MNEQLQKNVKSEDVYTMTDMVAKLAFQVLGFLYILILISVIFDIPTLWNSTQVFWNLGDYVKAVFVVADTIILGLFLYGVAGVGLLWLKRWLPQFFVVFLILGILSRIGYYLIISYNGYMTDIFWGDVFAISVGVVALFFIFGKRHLFVN